jgi:DNA-directed RNA polymerase specialized sigma24 family protein
MAGQAAQHIDELEAQLVVRAQSGDRAAFSELYRRHSHPAWRLALAVGASTTVAEKAVVQGFTAALRRLRKGTTTLAMPFRLQVARTSAEAAAAAARRDGAPVDPAPNDLVVAFRRLPERWRAGLWLTAVEGGNPGQVAPVLALSAEATVSLVTRAALGLRERYMRIDGAQLDDVRKAVPELKALVVPIPDELEARAVAQWQAWLDEIAKDERHGLAAIVPMGAWTERAIATAAAGIIAAGIASAVALTSGSKSNQAPQLAAPAAATTGRALPAASTPNANNRLTMNYATVAVPPSTSSMFAPDLTRGGGRTAQTVTAASAGGAVSTNTNTPAGSAPATGAPGAAPAPGAPGAPAGPSTPPTTAPPNPASPDGSGGNQLPSLPPITVPNTPITPQSAPSTTVPSVTPAPAPGGGQVITINTGVLPPITVPIN